MSFDEMSAYFERLEAAVNEATGEFHPFQGAAQRKRKHGVEEITHSPIHTCAQDEEGIGLALRFPRLVGFIRKDKSPEDATTVKEIKEMFAMQKKRRKR